MALTISGSGGGLTLNELQAGAEWKLLKSVDFNHTLTYNNYNVNLTLADLDNILFTEGGSYTQFKVEFDFSTLKLNMGSAGTPRGIISAGDLGFVYFNETVGVDQSSKYSFIIPKIGQGIKGDRFHYAHIYYNDMYSNSISKGTSYYVANSSSSFKAVMAYSYVGAGSAVAGTIRVYGRK